MTTSIVQDGYVYRVTYWDTEVFEKVGCRITLRTEKGVKRVSATTTRKINQAFSALDLPYMAYRKAREFFVTNTETNEVWKDKRDRENDFFLRDNVLITLKV